MNWNLNDKTLMYGLIAACVVVFMTFAIIGVGMNVVVNKTTDSVIEKLQRYTPGPYHPAFDPDKVNTNFWNGEGAGPSGLPQSKEAKKPKGEDPWSDNWTDLRR